MNTVLQADLASERIRTTLHKDIKTPFLLVTAGQDDICCSEEAKAFFNNCAIDDKTLLEIADASHSLVRDKQYASIVVNETVSWQNLHLI